MGASKSSRKSRIVQKLSKRDDKLISRKEIRFNPPKKQSLTPNHPTAPRKEIPLPTNSPLANMTLGVEVDLDRKGRVKIHKIRSDQDRYYYAPPSRARYGFISAPAKNPPVGSDPRPTFVPHRPTRKFRKGQPVNVDGTVYTYTDHITDGHRVRLSMDSGLTAIAKTPTKYKLLEMM